MPLAYPSSSYPDPLTRDVVPIQCHSHNDYWRPHPLLDALRAGCVSVEADVWHIGQELYVGHSRASLVPARTLTSMYISPIREILETMNPNRSLSPVGVFDAVPLQTLYLLIDFKTRGLQTWNLVVEALEPLRRPDWLTRFDGTTLHTGPVTLVATGNVPFERVMANRTQRDIFFDAPLASLESSEDTNLTFKYNTTNSVYASAPLVQSPPPHIPVDKELESIVEQIKAANIRGLKARYWNTPPWPIATRNEIWTLLVNEGVGVLNVDDLDAVQRFWET